MNFCIKVENALRQFFTGKPGERPMEVSFFMGDGPPGNDPLEAIYHISYWDKATETRVQGKLPWAVLDAWDVCEGAMDGMMGRPEYRDRSYYTRLAWVAKAEEILRRGRAELDAILAQPDSFYEPKSAEYAE